MANCKRWLDGKQGILRSSNCEATQSDKFFDFSKLLWIRRGSYT